MLSKKRSWICKCCGLRKVPFVQTTGCSRFTALKVADLEGLPEVRRLLSRDGRQICATINSVDFNPSAMSRVVVRAANWLGYAVMSLPAIRALRGVFPHAHLAIMARPWVADLYARERSIDSVVPYAANSFAEKRAFAARLR